MFVTNWISPTKIQKISEITNFFRHYFLSRTEVFIPLFYGALFLLLSGYGKILPLARATLCHCQARNDTSGERIPQDCHFDSTTPLAQ